MKTEKLSDLLRATDRERMSKSKLEIRSSWIPALWSGHWITPPWAHISIMHEVAHSGGIIIYYSGDIASNARYIHVGFGIFFFYKLIYGKVKVSQRQTHSWVSRIGTSTGWKVFWCLIIPGLNVLGWRYLSYLKTEKNLTQVYALKTNSQLILSSVDKEATGQYQLN